MQIPILNGIYTDTSGDYRTRYPRNMTPVPKQQGVSNGYLRPSEGILPFTDVTGIDRGGINWNDEMYRVTGDLFVKINANGTRNTLGSVGDNGKQVTMCYSFDRLAIASDEKLYIYDGESLQQVTDPDLGVVLDVIWIDGQFVTTDGEFLVALEIGNPFAVNPFKYGSSEIDPDPIVAVQKIRNEVVAINRYTIEYFDNVGGGLNVFPFQRVNGAELQRGCVGTHANAPFSEALAFVGGALNEEIAVWVGRSGSTVKLSTRDIDEVINSYTSEELALINVEARRYSHHDLLYIHLPDQTLVYDAAASTALGEQVWFTLDSGLTDEKRYRAQNFVRCYDEWFSADPLQARIGTMTDLVGSHYGEKIAWSFGTSIMYNESNGAIFHEVKLIALTGRARLGVDPTIYTRYTNDGLTWSAPRGKKAGKQGETFKNVSWRKQGRMKEVRQQEFSGTSDAHITVARFEAMLEGLAK